MVWKTRLTPGSGDKTDFRLQPVAFSAARLAEKAVWSDVLCSECCLPPGFSALWPSMTRLCAQAKRRVVEGEEDPG